MKTDIDLSGLRDCVWLHQPGQGISRDGLAALGRVERRLSDSLACQRSQPAADLVRINCRSEPARFAAFTLKNFLMTEVFPNDERITAAIFAEYLVQMIPAIESQCPAGKEAR